jgi:signal transduction histidine kinase
MQIPGKSAERLRIGAVQLSRELLTEVSRAIKSLPGATLEEIASVDVLLDRRECAGLDVLVLGSSTALEERERVVRAVSSDGLPCWPVVVFAEGRSTEALWYAPPGRRTRAELAHLLRLARSNFTVWRELLRARGDLWTIVRRISHEMRSPLGCIITSADVIREEMAEHVPAAGPLAQPILDSARELVDLIERLMVVARASAAPLPLAPVEMNLAWWTARERCEATIRQSGAEIVEPESWPAVIGVQDWLATIWQALLANALQHGGAAPRIEVGWKGGSDGICFFVQDEGPGVLPEIEPTLFRPFHQLHQADSGRGLGLTTVQRLVELQGGRCSYQPVLPRGARFQFVIPGAGEVSS